MRGQLGLGRMEGGMSSTYSSLEAEPAAGAPPPFEQRFQVGWCHLDANAHMSNTAYLDLAATVRVVLRRTPDFDILD